MAVEVVVPRLQAVTDAENYANEAREWAEAAASLATQAGWNGLYMVAVPESESEDCTASLQAEIDAALALNRVPVLANRMYQVFDEIVLGDLDDYSRQYILLGYGATGDDRKGGIIRQNTPGKNGLVVAPGNGNLVQGIGVWGPPLAGGNTQYPPNGTVGGNIGIAITGGSAGASRTQIVNCQVLYFHTGIKTGYISDALSDSNTIRNCAIKSCNIGVHFSATQNYINTVDSCVIAYCKIAIYNPTSKNVLVDGGNLSSVQGANYTYAMTSVGSITAVGTAETGFRVQFNATITDGEASTEVGEKLSKGMIDAFCVDLPTYGLIPLRMTAYNTGTGAATFISEVFWSNWAFGERNPVSVTDLPTELAAITSIDGAALTTIFYGKGFTAYGVHTENPVALTRLLDASTSFAGVNQITIDDTYMNYDPAFEGVNARLARLSEAFGFIYLTGSMDVKIAGLVSGGGNAIRLKIINDSADVDLRVSDCVGVSPRQVYARAYTQSIRTYRDAPNGYTRGAGVGIYDTYYLGPTASGSRIDANLRRNYPQRGFFPEAYVTPRLYDDEWAAFQTTLGSIGSYQPILGGRLYRVGDEFSGSAADPMLVMSTHSGYSYGQDFTGVTWSGKGGSPFVKIDATTLAKLSEGVVIGLDGVNYLIAGIDRQSRQVMIIPLSAAESMGNPGLSGTLGAAASGTTITQQAYVWKKIAGTSV